MSNVRGMDTFGEKTGHARVPDLNSAKLRVD